MRDEEVKVIPRKTTFRDVRMHNVVCPLCSDGLRIVKMEEHAFGELGFWQCDSCGCIIDICNMVNRPTEYTEIINDFKSCTHVSIRSFLKEYSAFPKMNYRLSIHSEREEKERTEFEKEDRKIKCQHCEALFLPRKNAKNILIKNYCPECREKEEVILKVKKEEEKAAKKEGKKKQIKRKT